MIIIFIILVWALLSGCWHDLRVWHESRQLTGKAMHFMHLFPSLICAACSICHIYVINVNNQNITKNEEIRQGVFYLKVQNTPSEATGVLALTPTLYFSSFLNLSESFEFHLYLETS